MLIVHAFIGMDEDGQPIRFPGLRPVALQCGRVDVDGGCVRPVGDDTVHPCRHLLRISCPGECHGAIVHVLAGAFVDCGFQRGGFVRSGQPCALDDGGGHDSCPFGVGDDDGDAAYLRVAVIGRRPYGEVVEVILRRCDSRTEMREAFLQSRDDLYVHR